MSDPIRRLFPETAAAGYSRADATVEFYVRVNALLRPDSVVVDFGAGRGLFMEDPVPFRRNLRMFKGRAHQVIGVDVDPVVKENESVDRAIVWEPGTPIELPDASVDLVVSDVTFEHIDDPELVVTELERIVKPGGWVCARTPNRWGYIAIAARLVPNHWHARILSRLQANRQERDVFPTRYRLNTLAAVRREFAAPAWEVHGYAATGEPGYAGRSRLLTGLVYGIMRRLPRRFGEMYFFFIRRTGADAREP